MRLLVRLTLLALCVAQLHTTQVTSSSSYIGDYFLPTAKIALNKIQQSFTPTTTTSTTTISEAPASSGEAVAPVLRAQDAGPQEEPKKSEFVSLDVARQAVESLVTPSQVKLNSSVDDTSPEPDDSSTPQLVLSSSESVSVEPSTTTETEPESTTVEDASQAAIQEETTTSTTSAPSDELISNQISAELESIRETELEAIAAVDASIGFGESQLTGSQAGASATDACYDEYGNARYCEPEFENVAFERQVEASSECGSPASRFCTSYVNEHGDRIRNCHICDSAHPKKRHPASYLTDLNNSQAPSCWVSAPLEAPANVTEDEPNLTARRDNVTLTLNLDKRYEITYVSVQFCSLKPDSLALMRSNDFGKTWTPYQFQSSQCGRLYGKQTSPSSASQFSEQTGQLEPVCISGSSSVSRASSPARLAYSTLDGARNSTATQDKSQLQDWLSATNIRLVLDAHQSSWIQSAAAHAHHSESKLETSLTQPSLDTYNYAVSDLTVGARCKCNGHASRCVHSTSGRLECDCQHNTDGPDCERCLPLHHDRPWQRASHTNANPCQPCNCNGHSRKCRFDPELYQLSGKRSGGVCIDCKDNTTGRHCHYCKEGYTRDQTRQMSDKEACKPCDCHPVGSVGKVCNQTTGQCPCKEGVTGLECNRCAPGYQQSSSPSEPCLKLPENDINYEPAIETTTADQPEPSNTQPEVLPATGSNDQIDEDPSIVLQTAPTFRPHQPPTPLDEGPKVEERARNKWSPSYNAAPHWPQGQQYGFADRAHVRNVYKANRPMVNHRKPAHRPHDSSNDYEPDQSLYEPLDDQWRAPQHSYNSNNNNNNNGHGSYGPAKRIYVDQYGQRVELRRPLASANLEPDATDETSLFSNNRDDGGGSYMGRGGGQLLGVPIYDDPYNNQIQGSEPLRPRPRLRQQVSGGALPAVRPPAGGSVDQPAAGRQAVNSLVCGDCQAATRRLNFKQFCHLDYAIKATILTKQTADDWTKYELEIEDIFKSPSSSSLLVRRSQRHAIRKHYVSSEVVQASGSGDNNPSGGAAQAVAPLSPSVASNRTVADESVAQPDAAALPLHRALKVGGVQVIWVPTEDVGCKCPRLRLRTTYLLMGQVDTKVNSATSIPLDRHGVALEWRSSSQEKLMRYQRRHSRGRC